MLQLLELVDDHVALYQLTLDRGTKLFEQVLNRKVVNPDQSIQRSKLLTLFRRINLHFLNSVDARQ